MTTTMTTLPDAAVLGEVVIVAAENARRPLTDAENLLTRGGAPTDPFSAGRFIQA